MKKWGLLCMLLVLSLVVAMAGCSVRTYPLTKDRVDQGLYAGNHGYLQGQPAQYEEKSRKTTRTTHVLEIELGSQAKVQKPASLEPVQIPEEPINREAYTSQSMVSLSASSVATMETYKVQKGDTLQKISQKFFGTTKKWHEIYEANRDVLKSPDRLYPGKTINIPLDSQDPLKEPQENLK